MDFNDTPEEAEFRLEVRAWLQANAPKDWRDRIRKEGMNSVCREWQAKKYDAGWACVNWPKEFGFKGFKPIQTVIFREEESKVAPPSDAWLVVGLACAAVVTRRS